MEISVSRDNNFILICDFEIIFYKCCLTTYIAQLTDGEEGSRVEAREDASRDGFSREFGDW